MEKEDFKKNSQNNFKNKWHETRMYGEFVRGVPEEIDKNLSWKLFVQSDLEKQTEATVCAAQRQIVQRIKLKRHQKIHCKDVQ